MSSQEGSAAAQSAHMRDRILAERHRRMVDSAARRLARELYAYGCPAPRAELTRRCGVDHWSQATLDEAIAAAERFGLIKVLPLGWVAPVSGVAVPRRPTDSIRRHVHRHKREAGLTRSRLSS